MDIRNRRALKEAADRSLAAAAYDPKKLILIHTGVSLLLALAATGLDMVLGTRIADTGGLSGLGMRSVLSTIQSFLRLANLVVLPFWELGLVFAAMRLAKGQETRPGSLLEGFRRWGPALRLFLIQALLYVGIGIVSMNIASYIFMLTPLALPLMEMLTPYLESPQTMPVLDEATALAVARATIPMLLIFLALYLLMAIPFSYQLRMANYALMDAPYEGAMVAMRKSRRLMRRRKLQLFKLDLSFWWFYAGLVLTSLVCYGDVFLPLLGVALPFSETVSFFLFFVLSQGMQLALYYFLRGKVAVTYAHAYGALCDPQPEVQPQAPRHQPWSYE